MRVFSAVFPPDDVVEDFSRAIDPLRRRYAQLNAPAAVAHDDDVLRQPVDRGRPSAGELARRVLRGPGPFPGAHRRRGCYSRPSRGRDTPRPVGHPRQLAARALPRRHLRGTGLWVGVWSRPGDDGRPYFELLDEHRFKTLPVASVVQPSAALALPHQASVAPLPQHAAPPAPPAGPVASEPCLPATVDW